MIGGIRPKYRIIIELFMYIFGMIALILLITGYVKNIVGHTNQYDNLTTPGWVFFSLTCLCKLLLL